MIYKLIFFQGYMAYKLINASEAKSGTTISIEGDAYVVRSNEISKTGKHGHAKCRMDAISVIDGSKKVLTIPGHERLDVPLIEKRNAQVLSSTENSASVMDLESFETIEVPVIEELRESLNEGDKVEYWIIEGGAKIIKRKV